MRNSREIYDSWNLTYSQIPKRSSLYSLQPIGIGTPLVECLTSYLSRLSEAHCSKVIDFKRNALGPSFISSQIRNRINKGFDDFYKTINGHGLMAIKYVEVVEELTSRTDIRYMTLLSWSDILISDILRPNKAWCPACYDENSSNIYDPLLLQIKLINMCSKHEIPLRENCSKCNKKQSYFRSSVRIGFCHDCGEWLGKNNRKMKKINNSFSKSDKQREEWIIKNFSDLIELAPSLNYLPTRILVFNKIRKLVDKYTKGRHGALERKLETKSAGAWYSQKSRVSIANLLKICYLFDISLSDFLLTPGIEDVKLTNFNKKKIIYPVTSRKNTVKNHKEIIKELNSSLNEYPPPTLITVLNRVNYKRYSANKLCPDLCKKIVDRHREYKKEMRIQRENRIIQEVRDLAIKLYKEGIYPSPYSMNPLLTEKNVFLMKIARDALKEVLKELGIER